MDHGMLWYDSDQKTSLTDRVNKAVKFYSDKYGILPNRCWVNPKQIGESMIVNGVSVRADKKVIKNHLWIGVE